MLGVTWSVAIDELMIDLKFIAREANTLNLTKHHIVSIASKIYDPIGLVSPITIRFKVLLQELHGARIEWDEEINGELLDRWNALISCISGSEPVRRYFQLKLSECQWRLIGFSDSSVKACAAVVYLKCEGSEARQMSLVAAKTRVAPIRSQTIPRLEFLGALLLARLISSVYNALKSEVVLESSRCYTDSQVALYWIKGERREWKPFVYNRVREIRELVPSENWGHCVGRSNPADIPSRGSSVGELIHSHLWWNGPEEVITDRSGAEWRDA